jgi:hypothetical protein
VVEIWDLMKLLACGNDHVLGRTMSSPWWKATPSLDIVSGKTTFEDTKSAWPWIRGLVPHGKEATIFHEIRAELSMSDQEMGTDKNFTALDSYTRDDLDTLLAKGEVGKGIPLLRYHNPLARHVVLRRRSTLEEKGLMERIAVNLHPREGTKPGLFAGSALHSPGFYSDAHDKVKEFTRAIKIRQKGSGFLGNLMMQRICSSVASGLATAEKMLAGRKHDVQETAKEDPELAEAMEEIGAEAYASLMDDEAAILEQIIEHLRKGAKDPKGDAVIHFLDGEGWLELGSIVFSQYYDTARWIAGLISEKWPEEPIAVYAGMGKSGMLLGGRWQTVDREDIKKGVREHKIRIVCATDAACEGLNLQTLGTLINVDLPWNPSKIEQRIGRIKRFGQKRKEVDMANLVYEGTLDERVYARLSERMRKRYDILGSLPDTIEDEWIDDIEAFEKHLMDFTKKEIPKEIFCQRYGDFLDEDGSGEGWEKWKKVVSKQELEEHLLRPWSIRQKARAGA